MNALQYENQSRTRYSRVIKVLYTSVQAIKRYLRLKILIFMVFPGTHNYAYKRSKLRKIWGPKEMHRQRKVHVWGMRCPTKVSSVALRSTKPTRKDSIKSSLYGHAFERVADEIDRLKVKIWKTEPLGHFWRVNQVLMYFMRMSPPLCNTSHCMPLKHRNRENTIARTTQQRAAKRLDGTGMALSYLGGWWSDLRSSEHEASKSSGRRHWAIGICKSHTGPRRWWKYSIKWVTRNGTQSPRFLCQ